MCSGKTHDRLTVTVAKLLIPTVLIGGLVQSGISNQAIAYAFLSASTISLSCLFSGYYLSPDIDVMGYLRRRYGFFRFIWLPYYKACHLTPHYRTSGKATHRSLLAHTPLIGTASRVFYLAAIATLIIPGSIATIGRLIATHPTALFQVAIGLEIGSLTHIFADVLWTEND